MKEEDPDEDIFGPLQPSPAPTIRQVGLPRSVLLSHMLRNIVEKRLELGVTNVTGITIETQSQVICTMDSC